MIRARIIRNGTTTNQADWPTQELAETWVTENATAFGLPDRWKKEMDFTGDESIESSTDSREVDGVTEYFFPQNWSVSYDDVSVEIAQRNALQLRRKKQDFGAFLIAKITELNTSKGLDQAGLSSLLADANAATIERLLWSGSLEFAQAAILAYPGNLYTTQEKQAFADEIQNFLDANPS